MADLVLELNKLKDGSYSYVIMSNVEKDCQNTSTIDTKALLLNNSYNICTANPRPIVLA